MIDIHKRITMDGIKNIYLESINESLYIELRCTDVEKYIIYCT